MFIAYSDPFPMLSRSQSIGIAPKGFYKLRYIGIQTQIILCAIGRFVRCLARLPKSSLCCESAFAVLSPSRHTRELNSDFDIVFGNHAKSVLLNSVRWYEHRWKNLCWPDDQLTPVLLYVEQTLRIGVLVASSLNRIIPSHLTATLHYSDMPVASWRLINTPSSVRVLFPLFCIIFFPLEQSMPPTYNTKRLVRNGDLISNLQHLRNNAHALLKVSVEIYKRFHGTYL